MRGIIKCPKCGEPALYDTEDQSDLSIHAFTRGPFFIQPTEICYLGFFNRRKARKLLKKEG